MKQKSYGDPHRWKTWPWQKVATAVHEARRAARTYGQPDGELTKEIFARIHLLPCTYCGVMPANGVDHEVPFRLGGQNVLGNLVPACLSCNRRRGAYAMNYVLGNKSPGASLWPTVTPTPRGPRDQWHPPQKTHCPQGHAYSDENTYLKMGTRYCRECRRTRNRLRARAIALTKTCNLSPVG